MSNTDNKKVEHGMFHKAVSVMLGVASVAAIVMSFIPGLNLEGAILQGGITLVQTGMDLADGNKKKAALDFGIGALLTAASIIPFLGAVGNFAKTSALIGTEASVEGIGIAARVGKFFKGAVNWVGEGLGTVGKWLEHIPGVKWLKEKMISPVVGSVKTVGGNVKTSLITQENSAIKWAAGTAEKPGMFRKTGEWMANHSKTRVGLELGTNAAGIGLGFVNDSPPGNLANPNSAMYASSQDDSDTADTRWRKRIRQEQEQKQLAAAAGATH